MNEIVQFVKERYVLNYTDCHSALAFINMGAIKNQTKLYNVSMNTHNLIYAIENRKRRGVPKKVLKYFEYDDQCSMLPDIMYKAIQANPAIIVIVDYWAGYERLIDHLLLRNVFVEFHSLQQVESKDLKIHIHNVKRELLYKNEKEKS